VAWLAVIGVIFALSVWTHITIPFPWAMLVAFTVFLIVITIKIYRRFLAVPVFWLVFLGLMCAHSAIFIAVLRNYPGFRPFWFVPVVIVEAQVFGAIFDLVLTREPHVHRRPK
jgi:hypothetical protein